MKNHIEKYDYKAQKTEYKGIMFDSLFESRVYKVLELVPGVHIETHIKTGKMSWKIDFKLSAYSLVAAEHLATLRNVDGLGGCSSLSDLYLEAKGVIDKNFIKRLGQLDYHNPKLLSKLLLVGSDLKAVAWYSNRENKILTKPVVPFSLLSATIKSVIVPNTKND